jgi:hypothetical protein
VADGVVDEEAERGLGRLGTVDVGDVDPEYERGLVAAGVRLEQRRLGGGELDRIRTGIDKRLDHRRHVLDAGEEARLAEEPVIHRDVYAALGLWVEEAVEAIRSGHVSSGDRLDNVVRS